MQYSYNHRQFVEVLVIPTYGALRVEADARDNLGDMVLTTLIPRNVRLSEAPSFAMPIIDYDPTSKGAEAYTALARELTARWAPRRAKETTA